MATVCPVRTKPGGDGFPGLTSCRRSRGLSQEGWTPLRETLGNTDRPCCVQGPHRPQGTSSAGQVPAQPCVLLANRIKEVKGFQALSLEKTEKYEKENCGGFRLIYPSLNSDKYEKFFQDNNSLFQNTVASRARELYAR